MTLNAIAAADVRLHRPEDSSGKRSAERTIYDVLARHARVLRVWGVPIIGQSGAATSMAEITPDHLSERCAPTHAIDINARQSTSRLFLSTGWGYPHSLTWVASTWTGEQCHVTVTRRYHEHH